ncbi:DUF4190 domain-containing protein [Solirubrobacter soli]|uniref:DUF4190 domain-containing protein n=1 Tax=Solirubrobacter soli TaxID=363832 RepID=UPI000413CDA1|nr:DUF4190 domain-containing protein [Solirubrobacter soli]
MSLPGDENPNPQWQRREDESKPQWTSGNPLGEQPDEPPAWQQQPQSEWQREPAPQWQQPAPQQQYAGWTPQPRTPGQAVASLILGIVGLVFCPIIASVLALVFGYQAKSQIDAAGGQLGGRGVAVAGIVLGWVSLGFWGLFFTLAVIGGIASS